MDALKILHNNGCMVGLMLAWKIYNEYCLSAKNDRKTKDGIDFETSFLKEMKEEKQLLNSRNNKSDIFVQPYNDLCDDSGSDKENNND